MKHITFYLDFISPYAYLAFERLPQVLLGHSYTVDYRPVLFAGLLKHHGQLGPAEIPGKREWTYRQVMWLANELGVPLKMPQTHPFNPLHLLRLAFAAAGQGTPNRYVCEAIFRHVWQSGLDAAGPSRLAQLAAQLQDGQAAEQDLLGRMADAQVKARLKAGTDEAIAAGVFGVPAFSLDGKFFWGLDALPMLRAFMDRDPWFASEAWHQADVVPKGAAREK
jgi:2-hydroxychromene-2-carboxylate isomerase